MSRYSDFEEEGSSETESLVRPEDHHEPICIHDLIPSANPLMDKIEYSSYVAQHHFPVQHSKLPAGMSYHVYHQDPNHMTLLDESVFAH